MIVLAVTLIGSCLGLGLLLVFQGARGVKSIPTLNTARFQVDSPLLLVALFAGCAVYFVTGWPVGGLLLAVFIGLSPKIFGKTHHENVRRRSEAIAIFTEQIRDNMYTARGVTQALLDAASDPPAPIANELDFFVHNLKRNDNATSALQRLGEDLDNSFADFVIVVLTSAVGHSTDQTAPTITRLAETIRQDQEWKLRIEVTRSRIRTSTKMIVGTFAFLVAYLYIVSPELLAAYDSTMGQLWLLAVGSMFGLGIVLFQQFSKFKPPARFKARHVTGEPVSGGVS